MTVNINIKITRQTIPPPPPILRQQHRSPGLLLLLALFILPILLPADTMYRYVNEHGVVVYSQTPPAGQAAEVIKPAPGPSEAEQQAAHQRLQNVLKTQQSPSPTPANTTDKQQQEYTEILAKNCTIARDNLQTLEQLGDRALIMSDGKKVYPTADERETLINQARQQIDDNCR